MNGKAKGIIEFVKQHWQEMLCSLLFAYLSVSVVNIFIIDESAANISFVNSYKTLISILLMAAFFSYSFFLSMLISPFIYESLKYAYENKKHAVLYAFCIGHNLCVNDRAGGR